jgi:hypothetical protein
MFMLTAKEVTAIFETLLSSPGMTDEVKVSFRAPRKTILLLSKSIELGLSVKDSSEPGGLFAAASEQAMEGVKSIAGELLSHAGLTEMYQKLNSLQTK